MRLWIQGAVALLAGAIATWIIAANWPGTSDDPTVRTVPSSSVDTSIERSNDGQVVNDFVDDWERYRRVEAIFEETTLRTAQGSDASAEQRAGLSEIVTVVQRFPDRIVRSGDSLNARIGSRIVGCQPQDSANVVCFDSGSYRPEAELDIELGEIRAAVASSSSPYRLTTSKNGCYELVLRSQSLAPKFGERATFCFDRTTRILLSEESLADDINVKVTRRITETSVSDSDLALPAIPTKGSGG